MPINDFIYDDLKTRIEARDGFAGKLTLAALSERYQVSLTPVRMAIGRLIDDRYLVKLDNGRVAVNQSAPRRRRRIAAPAPQPASLEAAIETDVVERSLRGDAEYLREEAVAARHGVGRTVVRPILSRLAGKGLLEYVPRCGWRPRLFDARDLDDFLVAREALELKALDLAHDRLDDAVLRQMLADNRRRTRVASGALTNGLHGYWIGLANNRYITDFFNRQGVYFGKLFDLAAPGADAIEEMAAQHCEILEALLAGRRRDARRALSQHIRDQKPIVALAMEKLERRRPFEKQP